MSNSPNNELEQRKAFVFNIERFATEDGKGIRTVVFLKGCTLHCEWCANPESLSLKPVVLFNENLCKGCDTCRTCCPENAIRVDETYGLISDPAKCISCGKCIDACLHNARTMCGEYMTQDELMDILLKDKEFYRMSGGGITFSGGEPLLQSLFIRDVTLELKTHDIPVLVETCGHILRKNIDDVIDCVDAIYFDVKQMDTELHKKYTGRGNELILDNLTYLSEHYSGELSVRYPYIPGFNSDNPAIDAMVEFVGGLNRIDELVFLPYHRLGLPKYRGMGKNYKLGETKSLKKNDLYHLLERYRDCGIPLKIQ